MNSEELLKALEDIHTSAIETMQKINSAAGKISHIDNPYSAHYFNEGMTMYAEFLRCLAMAKENAKIDQ